MKTVRKFLTVLLALALCVGLAPAALADDGFEIEDGVLVSYAGPGGDIAIPDGVKEIGPYAFFFCYNLTSVTFPDSVTKIGEWAFVFRDTLKSISLPSSLVEIEEYAFSGCTALTSISIPSSVKTIGGNAFSGCHSLTSVTVPATVESFGPSVFRQCEGLTSVTLADGLTEIPPSMFDLCENITSISIPSSVKKIGPEAFQRTSLVNVSIPYGVTEIGFAAFHGCYQLVSIEIPDSVTTIGANIFDNCNRLTRISLPDGITEIPSQAFYWCKALENVKLPSGLTKIGEQAFSSCDSLSSITLPASVRELGRSAFAYCKQLTHLDIPEGVSKLPNQLLEQGRETALTSVSIPGSVTEIGRDAIYGKNLTDIYYAGSKADWDKIRIEEPNKYFAAATLHCADGASASPVPPSDPAPVLPSTGFYDVQTDDYFAAPVAWARQNGITDGVTSTSFEPHWDCTNGQILTFLWRAAGQPEPSIANPFSNELPDYCRTAVIWAYQNGLVSSSSFDGYSLCDRATAVYYLWRAAGSPSPGSIASFSDVPSDAPYAVAVSWAVEKGITTGTSSAAFSPDQICSRAQIVTFLYRDRAQ